MLTTPDDRCGCCDDRLASWGEEGPWPVLLWVWPRADGRVIREHHPVHRQCAVCSCGQPAAWVERGDCEGDGRAWCNGCKAPAV